MRWEGQVWRCACRGALLGRPSAQASPPHIPGPGILELHCRRPTSFFLPFFREIPKIIILIGLSDAERQSKEESGVVWKEEELPNSVRVVSRPTQVILLSPEKPGTSLSRFHPSSGLRLKNEGQVLEQKGGQ